MATALAQPNLISLAAGFTDPETLPVREVQGLLREILSAPRRGQMALQYGTTAGDPLLRDLTARRLCSLDAPRLKADRCTADRVVITNGSQQLLYMVTEALCDPGDIVLVEDPTYFVYLGILQSHGIQARGIRMEPDGLSLAHLEEVLRTLKRSGDLRRVKLLYSVTYYQNPTGITTSEHKKAETLRLLREFEPAAGHPLYYLEDAAYRELRFGGVDVPSAMALAGSSDRILYAGTYSKPFATGIRVGFGLLPEPVLTAVLRIKGNHDFGSCNFAQQVLAQALQGGRFEAHLQALRKRYASKARLMEAGMKASFPSAVGWQTPQGGLYFWPRLPGRHRSGPRSALFRAALAKGVLYVPGELCYAIDPTRRRPSHELRLSFGNASAKELGTGLERLGAALHACL
jgi:2-aminoadipate transaminase